MYASCATSTLEDVGWNGTEPVLLSNGTISGSEVLAQVGGVALPWYWSLLIITGFGIAYRIVAYIFLRLLHKKR